MLPGVARIGSDCVSGPSMDMSRNRIGRGWKGLVAASGLEPLTYGL